jgi:hypothetical protein
MERGSHRPCECWVALTTNTHALMPDFNILIIDHDAQVLNTSLNILDNEEPKFYAQVITRPNGDL